MNIEKYLSQIPDLENEIQSLITTRNETMGLANASSKLKASDPIYKVIDYADASAHKMNQLLMKKIDILNLIDQVEDVNQRIVLRYIYGASMTVEQIAKKLNYKNTRVIKRRHKNGLIALQKLIDGKD